MRFLLDTHVLLWWRAEPDQLSTAALDALSSPENELWLSVVSLWELQIKISLGKLQLARPLNEIVAAEITTSRMKLLRVEPEHVFALDDLPPLHRDPFDRLLIAQARIESAILISADQTIQSYPIAQLW